MYIKANKAAAELGVHTNTLRNWAEQGKIRYIRQPGGQRYYDIASVGNADALKHSPRREIVADLVKIIKVFAYRIPNLAKYAEMIEQDKTLVREVTEEDDKGKLLELRAQEEDSEAGNECSVK